MVKVRYDCSMKNWKNALRFLPLSLLVFLLAGCGEQNLSALDPRGPQAQWLYDNMMLSIYVMIFVSVVVFAIYVIFFLDLEENLVTILIRNRFMVVRH